MIRKRRIVVMILVVIFVLLIGYGFSIFNSKEQKDSGQVWFSENGSSHSYIINNTDKVVLLKLEVSCEADESNSKGKVNVKVTNSDLEEIKSFKIGSEDKMSKWVIVNSSDYFYVNVSGENFQGMVDIMNYTYTIF